MMIQLDPDVWEDILAKIKIEYADTPSVFLIRSTMRRVLGFTVREHQQWISVVPNKNELVGKNQGYLKLRICLDFYNDSQETFFRLKYL